MGQPKLKEQEAAVTEVDDGEVKVAPPPFERPQALSPRTLGVLVGLVALINLPLIHYYLMRGPAEANATLPFQDDYSAAGLPSDKYFSTGGHWRTVDGWMLSPGVKNNPLWLQAKLPQNVAIEFDARSQSPEGDIKVELFGDGVDHASGYVFIHGGWGNQKSIIARLDEHGLPFAQVQGAGTYADDSRVVVEGRHQQVQVGRTYHWRIERRGGTLSWFIDGQPYMTFDDPKPLVGPKHDRFGFSSWEAQLYFDNLKVEAL